MKKCVYKKLLQAVLAVSIILCTLLACSGCAKVQLVDEKPIDVVVTGENRCFILDTDWLSDVDDAVAVRYLVRKHISGEITLLGLNVDAQVKTSGPSLDSFVAKEGVRLPISVDHKGNGLGVYSSYHSPAITYGAGSVYATSAEYPDSVEFYRKTLASLPDGIKCDIISVGFMNSLVRLLHSAPDEYSPLSGVELVKERVGTLWAMAGRFPSGKEFNINRNAFSKQSAITISEQWVTPIVFLGYEVGKDVKTGSTVCKELGRDDVLYRCLLSHGSIFGRSSWDPMTAYLAVTGSPEDAGFTKVVGTMKVYRNGSNSFEINPEGKHCYVVKAQSNNFYRDKIDQVVAAHAK